MRYRKLGSSDLEVSEICLGSWMDRSLGRASLSVGETTVHKDSCVEVSISRLAVRLTATDPTIARRWR
jgi:hypothetical protein